MSDQIRATIGYAGTAIRYAFLLVGTLFFGIVALAVWRGWSVVSSIVPMAAEPVQVAVPELARLKPSSKAWKSGLGWQQEVQYGRIYDRDTDFRLLVTMPSQTVQNLSSASFYQLPDIREFARARYAYPAMHYDLETRFGPVRAAHFEAEVDGRTKLCMGFASRFDTGSFTYRGWFCEANGARPSPSALACMLDRIVIKGRLPSAEAQAFVETMVRRPGRCSADPVSQTVDTRPPRPPRRL